MELSRSTSSTKVEFSCNINFNFLSVTPRENLTGHVEIRSKENATVQQILIEVSGVAECKWTYDRHLVKPPKIYRKGTVFSGKQEFYLSRHTLAGGSNGSVTLAKEALLLPFKCSVPEHLPATWLGQHGTIKYMAKVIVKMLDVSFHVVSREVIVKPYRNLRLEKHLLCEARQDVHRQFHFTLMSLGNVDVSVWLPLCGIAAGQSIPLLCTITNASRIHFGGLIFVLTQMEIYRTQHPTRVAKTFRKDICRVPRMVDILKGKYEYYCVLETDPNTIPTNQFWRCYCCQVTYEVWVSLQGVIPRYSVYGYPNVDTPGIPLIIGTEPLCTWDSREVTNDIMGAIYAAHPPIDMEPFTPDDEVEEMLNNADEELDIETEENLQRQVNNQPIFDPKSDESIITEEDTEKSTSSTPSS